MKSFIEMIKGFNKQLIKTEQPVENKLEDGNQIIGNPILVNSKIIFAGKNNILFTPKDVIEIHNSTIHFGGDNSVVFLGSRSLLNLSLKNDAIFYLGKDNYINKNLTISAMERKHIIIGNKCLFSTEISLITSDAHAFYDCKTKKRINHGKSIYIGDHVWVGQQASLLKGTHIASGSIIGANSVLSNKIVPSNCVFAGNPAKLIKKGVYFTDPCVYMHSEEQLAKLEYDISAAKDFMFEYDTSIHLPFNEIDSMLDSISTPRERIEYLMTALFENEDKNRFAL